MTTLPGAPVRAAASPGGILVLAAGQSLLSALRMTEMAKPSWVVIVREEEWSPQPFYYAVRPDELKALQAAHKPSVTLRVALDLHETGASGVADDAGAVIAPAGGGPAPSTRRTITLDGDGAPSRVSELEPWTVRSIDSTPREVVRTNGDRADMRLATSAPMSMRPGDDDTIDVFITAAADALQLPGAVAVSGSANEPISVVLSILGDAVVVGAARILKLPPPRPGTPSLNAFELRAVKEGTAQIAVMFRQGGSELGSLRHRVRVDARSNDRSRSAGEVASAPRVVSADGVLFLQVEPYVAGREVRYRYKVQSARLGLDFAPFESPPLLASDGSAAESELAFVRRIYANMTNQVLRTQDQVRRFGLEVEAFAESLCSQLFPPELVKLLWDARGDIDAVRVMSWEPYIPWELVKLALPKERMSDDRFLGQYGLVRWIAGHSAPRALNLENWSYYAATYPNNPVNDVVREVDYFTTRLPRHGITPVQIPATYDAFVEALQYPRFDVLHVACHGDVQEDDIDRAELLITDELVNGRPKFVSISANIVGKIARFKASHPLVFLNACEAGRLGESLTAWGGWPQRLITAGAGAVVAASWPVRDVASNLFATTFYDALLEGKSLSLAATDARTAAAAIGDATWLSFKVFGDPHACRNSVP